LARLGFIHEPSDKMQRINRKLIVAGLALAASSVAGFAVKGWSGLFLWPLALCALVVVLVICASAFGLVVRIRRRRTQMRRVWDRLRPLTTEQLSEIMRTPAHPDSQFAQVELMRRGANARPTKDQLFSMLTSGNSVQCGHAMANLQTFYPELSIPDGASNLDPPEIWQSRIEVFRRAG
jgi:hypothetical protein